MGRHRVRQRTLGRGGGRGGRGRSLTVNRPGWRSVVGPPRRAETIVMGPDAQTLWRDVEDFLSPGARESFQARTMPYQRCYLLYGPPGNGKSSLLQALSIKFKLELFFPKVRARQYSCVFVFPHARVCGTVYTRAFAPWLCVVPPVHVCPKCAFLVSKMRIPQYIRTGSIGDQNND
jgi:hypothetical protein